MSIARVPDRCQPVVRLLLVGVNELHDSGRPVVLLGDEQLTPRHVAGEFDRPVVPLGATATVGRHDRIVITSNGLGHIVDRHRSQLHRAPIVDALQGGLRRSRLDSGHRPLDRTGRDQAAGPIDPAARG
jgi:hypothetical protein